MSHPSTSMEEGVVCLVEDAPEDQELHGRPGKSDESTNQEEFDYVEQPSEDFFCPVTFELLLNPHQTTCCGNHLSEKAVGRLQRDGKPCPMCKKPKLVTIPDKFFKRKVNAVHIRCPHKASGCEWVGEVGGEKQHINTCPKRPWRCQYCDFTSVFDVSIQHVQLCTKYPVPCSNKCGLGTVPCCDVDKHRAECPLEPVPCEFADAGCNIKVARQDLSRHMEENQQQHLLSATLLNLKLTRETITEKDHQLDEKNRQIDESSRLLAEKVLQLAEKDHKLTENQKQLAEKDRQITERDHQLAEKDKLIAEKVSQLLELQRELIELQKEFMESTKVGLELTPHKFSLENFSKCQKEGSYGNWLSEAFYSHSGNCDLKLNMKTKQRGEYMQVCLRLFGESCKTTETKTFVVALQLLNQQTNRGHYFRRYESSIQSRVTNYSDTYDYITFRELYKRDGSTQYLKDDCLKFILWIKLK